MEQITTIYENLLGISYQQIYNKQHKIITIGIGSVSFMINFKELSNFITTTEEIINIHKTCTCPDDLKNKTIIYKSEDAEIIMHLSYDELFLLKDLLKGTKFKLEMNKILNDYRIN